MSTLKRTWNGQREFRPWKRSYSCTDFFYFGSLHCRVDCALIFSLAVFQYYDFFLFLWGVVMFSDAMCSYLVFFFQCCSDDESMFIFIWCKRQTYCSKKLVNSHRKGKLSQFDLMTVKNNHITSQFGSSRACQKFNAWKKVCDCNLPFVLEGNGEHFFFFFYNELM